LTLSPPRRHDHGREQLLWLMPRRLLELLAWGQRTAVRRQRERSCRWQLSGCSLDEAD
jgi:hypothetical protein